MSQYTRQAQPELKQWYMDLNIVQRSKPEHATRIRLILNPLNSELNPICHLLALLGGATIVVVSMLGVKNEVCVSAL